jgi:hypothetical protein
MTASRIISMPALALTIDVFLPGSFLTNQPIAKSIANFEFYAESGKNQKIRVRIDKKCRRIRNEFIYHLGGIEVRIPKCSITAWDY